MREKHPQRLWNGVESPLPLYTKCPQLCKFFVLMASLKCWRKNDDTDGLCAGVSSALPSSHEARTKLCAAHNSAPTQTQRLKGKKSPGNQIFN